MRQLPHRLRVLAAVVLASAAGASLAATPAHAVIPAPPSQWYGLPGLNEASGAQWVRALAYGTPPNVVYAGLEGGGVFKSVTGGATWSEFNGGFPNKLTTNVRALLTSSTGTTVYAGTDSGIWKSTGGNWQPLAQGAEDNPAQPKKLNQSVQALLSPTGGPMLAGVFSGGVYRSFDDGATWVAPAANNGMPASETVYGLTSNVPGVIYATAGSGVYVSLNQGTSWNHISDGIPGIASPITTWAYPERPNILFTSTGSNGIYRSVNGGLTWAPINDGLGAVRARGFQIFSNAGGAALYAATEDGLWAAKHTSSPIPPYPAPKWQKVTQNGLITQSSTNTIMWSLTAPVIPGAGAFGLIAGTQSNGGYFLSFELPDSTCPSNNTVDDTAKCPRISGELDRGATLTASTGTWTGTAAISREIQWQLCTSTSGASCSDIDGATESTLTIPEDAVGKRYRVVVTATNPTPSFSLIKRQSVITAAVTNKAGVPGYNQVSPPSVKVQAPGSQFSPEVGDQVYAEQGWNPITNVRDEFFNPAATSYSYRWLRCESGGDECNEIVGATSRTYTLQPADGTGTVRVRVRGVNTNGATELTSGPSYYVISQPAAVAAPLVIDGEAKSQAPSLSGTPYVGETLAGSVGGWVDPTTDFERRWLQCDGAGASCQVIRKPASVEPEEGSTYVLRAEDRGRTIRLRVKADVNGDLTPDGLDNHLPKAIEVDTAPSALITDRPVPGTGGGGGGGAGADTAAPSIKTPKLSKSKIVPGKAATISFWSSEAGTVKITITKPTTGRKVKGVCKPQTKKNRKAKKCTYQKLVTTITRPAGAGNNAVPFNGKIGKKKLARGSYRATIIVTDASGNVSAPVVLQFKIVKK